MLTETFELHPERSAPVFKFGQAPASARACNYDDWNELLGEEMWLGALKRMTLITVGLVFLLRSINVCSFKLI